MSASITPEKLRQLREMETTALEVSGQHQIERATERLKDALLDQADALLTIAEREEVLISAMKNAVTALELTGVHVPVIARLRLALATAGEYPRRLNEKAPSSMPL